MLYLTCYGNFIMTTTNTTDKDGQYLEDQEEDYILNRKLKRLSSEDINLNAILPGDLKTLILRLLKFIENIYDESYDFQKIDFSDSDFSDDMFRLINYNFETKEEYQQRLKRQEDMNKKDIQTIISSLNNLSFIPPEEKQKIINILER